MGFCGVCHASWVIDVDEGWRSGCPYISTKLWHTSSMIRMLKDPENWKNRLKQKPFTKLWQNVTLKRKTWTAWVQDGVSIKRWAVESNQLFSAACVGRSGETRLELKVKLFWLNIWDISFLLAIEVMWNLSGDGISPGIRNRLYLIINNHASNTDLS